MKKILTLVLLTFFVVTIYLPAQLVQALGVKNDRTVSSVYKETSNSNMLKISSVLTKWVLDEPSNTLFAISETGRTLFFINATTMKIEKSLTLKGSPTDIIKDNGKLYIALDDIKQIAIVDMVNRRITKILHTSSDPYRIVKDGNKLYYTEREEWCQIFKYDLTSNTDRALTMDTVYSPDIAINPDKHLLYIGETESSESKMIYYSTTENKTIGISNYKKGYGYLYTGRYTLFDGGNVFYAGRSFKQDDPTQVQGDFGEMKDIIFVKNDFVYTNTSIYNKKTHIKLGDYGSTMDLVEASSNTLYIYNKNDASVKRFNNSNKPISSSNIISLISGKSAPKIHANIKSVKINPETYKLQMKSKLTEWILDEPTNTLYGISEEDRALFFINAKTMNIEKSVTFKSKPTDIIKDNGKLYISLGGINQIAIVDMASRRTTKTVYTTSDPYRIVKDGNKIYYTEVNQWCKIYEYNLVSNTDRTLPIADLYEPDIAMNQNKHMLYIGESGYSASNMIYYSTTENKISSKTSYDNGYGFQYPERYTLFDGVNVFYAGRNFKMDNPTQIIGKYTDDNIIFAKYGYVFTNTSMYSRKSHSKIGDYGVKINLVELSSQADLYCYNEENNTIIKVEPDRTPPVVTGVKNGEIYKHTVTVSFNEGKATLDGKSFTKGSKVASQGLHVLKVVDSSGNSTTVKFRIDTVVPSGSIKINNGDATVKTTSVTLKISATDSAATSGIRYMMISRSSTFKGAKWIQYETTKKWTLSTGDGKKKVYIKFKDNAGNVSSIYSDTIVLDTKS